VMITKRVNGGRNGLKDRQEYLAKAKAIFGDAAPRRPVPPVEEVPDAPIAAEPEKSLVKSKITLGAGTVGAGQIADAAATAATTIEQVKQAKDSAEQIGIFEYATALLSNPRLLFAVVVLVICVGIIWWRWQHKRDHGV
jgi:cobalamin biosynthesis Mg chelatase CobN